MDFSSQPLDDKNHRPIPCETCPEDDQTMFDGTVDDETLADHGYADINEMTDDEVRRHGSLEGHCDKCNGPDDVDSYDSYDEPDDQ